MQNLKIETVALESLVPYANNAKKHPKEQVEQIAKSIQEFGNNDPIAVWHNKDGELEVVEGHGRLMALKLLGEKKCQVIVLDHMSDEQRRAYVHVHNKLTMNSDFDIDMLESELRELASFDDIDIDDFGFEQIDLDEIAKELDDVVDDDSDNDGNVGLVIYEPKETHHSVSDLYDNNRDDLDKLISEVEDEELRKMFEIRRAWFAEFNFGKVADYYAFQATPEEQRVFEALGMVILDRDKMLENGFAKMVGID